ncbi:ATP-grasp fold amidoligase family protein [Ruoffia tabacinasalis]|uniref:ATP-grasp fold amidoligase family protein n=1 Tax=Ruoffia tabacinasalis TaxID=87458 RepID=UPI0030D4982B
MDYKKLLPNKNLRLKILDTTNFIPDEYMLKFQYKVKTGRNLNLENPKRYTEKLQWYKLYYRDPLMTLCSDKYSVREYVKEKGLGDILNPLYGVYENVNDIDFDSLPNSFALKNTNGAGGNIFIENKKTVDIEKIKQEADKWLEKKTLKYGREWSYYNIQPRLVAERLLERDENNDIPDYKFFCFNGEVKYLYTMVDYTDNHDNGKCSFFTPDFEKLPYRRSEFPPIENDIDKPKNFSKMIEIAETLSKDFPHVRVDLYNIRGEIIFGELTFYNASGYTIFEPDEFDFILGDDFILPNKLKAVEK